MLYLRSETESKIAVVEVNNENFGLGTVNKLSALGTNFLQYGQSNIGYTKENHVIEKLDVDLLVRDVRAMGKLVQIAEKYGTLGNLKEEIKSKFDKKDTFKYEKKLDSLHFSLLKGTGTVVVY